ncbi:FkbM family methyltransferase [Sulfurospirillum halorespirans]|uniref:FkbM family methyltransferase n=1 Tax=Sulfurospirillum halorespirans DSM 13726 TaxID=1193502 RepID=A0A1D7TNU6_9BACT|nr:FkbM family methyltransferase [Sulfurospirillum halorespirans]AOO66671.1 FkbM family methyltransferase [Sulfurospirillum halorespirans DSM 13726]
MAHNTPCLIRIEDIPKEASLIIYGGGHAGALLIALLKLYRPDQSIRYVVDDVKRGEVEGIPVIASDALEKVYRPEDLVLVSVLLCENLLIRLDGIKTLRYALARLNYPHDVKECEALHAMRQSSLAITPRYTSLKEHRNGVFERVISLFEREEDRALYSMIVHDWHERSLDVRSYYVHHFPFIGRHYLEHLDFSDVKVIIEGGLADGINTIEFLLLMPQVEKVYGFEPLYHAYEHPHKVYLNANPKVEILTQGLWNENTTLAIDTSSELPLARVAPLKEADFASQIEIEVVSIDTFAAQRGIEKVDFIKFDIEGAELNALKGAFKTLQKDRPKLAISIYHSYNDLYQIALFLSETLEDYSYRLGQYHYDLGETVLYAFPKKM